MFVGVYSLTVEKAPAVAFLVLAVSALAGHARLLHVATGADVISGMHGHVGSLVDVQD